VREQRELGVQQSKTIRDEMTAAGFVLDEEHRLLAYQNFLVFK